MSNSKPPLKRAARSTVKPIRIKLSQVNADRQQEFCHRQEASLAHDALAPLVENLVSEGQQTPITVCASGQSGPDGLPAYVLVGGFRRHHSLLKAVADNLDPANIHEGMELDAVEVVRGEDQSQDDFMRDLVVRSVAENEQRKNLTNDEKLAVVQQFQRHRVPAPRAASALGVSDTQYMRFVSIVGQPWLHDLVLKQCVGSSDAAELAQKADKHGRMDDLRLCLATWVEARRDQLEGERRELAKVGRKLTGAAACVRKYLNAKLVAHWVKCIEEGRPLEGKPGFQFGIHFDADKKTITVPGRTFRADELAACDCETMIAELQDAAGQLIPILRERQMLEAARDVTDEERQSELARIVAAHQRRQEALKAANAGRPAPGFGAVEGPRPRDVDTRDEEPAAGGEGE